jgi:hypothetical protein
MVVEGFWKGRAQSPLCLWPLLSGMKYAQDSDGKQILCVDYDVVRANNHFTGAIYPPPLGKAVSPWEGVKF